MKSSLLVLPVICVILLFFVLSPKDVTGLTYPDTMSKNSYDNLGAVLGNASYNLGHGKYYEAIYYYDKALKSYPDNSDALFGKATALAKLQMYEAAIPYLDQVLQIYPHNFYAIYGKATALSSLGKYHDALFYYDQIQKMAPKFPLTEKDLKVIHGQYTNSGK